MCVLFQQACKLDFGVASHRVQYWVHLRCINLHTCRVWNILKDSALHFQGLLTFPRCDSASHLTLLFPSVCASGLQISLPRLRSYLRAFSFPSFILMMCVWNKTWSESARKWILNGVPLAHTGKVSSIAVTSEEARVIVLRWSADGGRLFLLNSYCLGLRPNFRVYPTGNVQKQTAPATACINTRPFGYIWGYTESPNAGW